MDEPIITFHNVSHVYQQAGAAPFQSLHQISFAVERGAFTAILGRSGSGKSTLLNLIAGLDRPSEGTISVAGQRLEAMGEAALASWRGRNVGVVFQFFQLLPTLTVRENLLLAMEFVGVVARASREARVRELLALVGILDQAHKLPAALSGGQQQRAAIARALVNEPSILVADEPTGNLDSNSANAVLRLFDQLLGRGVTLVVVTHDHAVARRASHTIELVDGRRVTSPPILPITDVRA